MNSKYFPELKKMADDFCSLIILNIPVIAFAVLYKIATIILRPV